MTTYEQALELMGATPTMLEALVAASSSEALTRPPAAEAWSVQQVLAHLLHVEANVIGERIRRMVTEEGPLLGPAPAVEPPGGARAILDVWRKARAANLAMLQSLTPDQLARKGRHPRYGTLTVREHAIEWAYHDLDHLRQILATLQAPLYPDIGPFQALYPPPS